MCEQDIGTSFREASVVACQYRAQVVTIQQRARGHQGHRFARFCLLFL
jgi:hypothetical protein